MVQSSNPKQKYQQKRGASGKGGRSEPSPVDQRHKQKAPLLVTVPETTDNQLPLLQDAMTTSNQEQVSVPSGQDEESEHTITLNSVEDKLPSVGDELMAVEDIETEGLYDKEEKQEVIESEETGTSVLPGIDEGRTEIKPDDGQSPLSPEVTQLQEHTERVCTQNLT